MRNTASGRFIAAHTILSQFHPHNTIHSGGYTEFHLQRYKVVEFGESQSTFRANITSIVRVEEEGKVLAVLRLLVSCSVYFSRVGIEAVRSSGLHGVTSRNTVPFT